MTKEQQLQNNIDWIVGGMENSFDDGYSEKMTLEEAVREVRASVFDIKVNDSTCYTAPNICEDLKFLGNEKINAMIIKNISSYMLKD